MNLSQKKKAKEAHETFKDFVDQFGPNDVYKEALLDVLLEIIYGQEPDNIHLLGEEEQKGNETSLHSGEGEVPGSEVDGP